MSDWINGDRRIISGAVVGGITGATFALYASNKVPDVRLLLNTLEDKVTIFSICTFAGILVGGMLGYNPVIRDYNNRNREL